MHWKRYKELPANQKYDETYYILGLDIGNNSTGLSFYNLFENVSEPIDPSGGYGKPSIPTVMQYIAETKEWVFGEYALLNQGAGTEVTLQALTKRLGQMEYLEIDGKPMSVAALLGLFIRDLLASVRNINPRAEIVGIVGAVPVYLSEAAHDELIRAFKLAGYEKELIALVPSRECVLTHYYHNLPGETRNVLLLDYGSQEVRGGVYSIQQNIALSLSSMFDESIGTAKVDEDVYALFESYYHAAEGHTVESNVGQLEAFVYQYKDILFQKNIRTKPAKLYFNFVYPPFQETITSATAEALVMPYRKGFSQFIRNTLKTLQPAKLSTTSLSSNTKQLSPQGIDAVICVGGGFEMLWARETVQDIFSPSQILIHKNAKLVIAEGAALIAASILGVSSASHTIVEDSHRLVIDIGFGTDDMFLPLVEQGSFWWQQQEPKLVLVNSPVEGTLSLPLVGRASTGETNIITSCNLSLPARPKGTTRLKISVNFSSNTDLTLNIEDIGFGELYPKIDYVKDFTVQLIHGGQT